MMPSRTCDRCGRFINQNFLACPHCWTRRHCQGLLTHEASVIPDIVAGTIDLKLVHVPRGGTHLEFHRIGCMSYCGHVLGSTMRREFVMYSPEEERSVCPRCWSELQRLIKVTAGVA